MEKVRTAVWQPPTDGPVGRDPDVRRAVREQSWSRDRIARLWGTHVFLALLCLLFGLPVSTVLAALAVLVISAFMLHYRLRMDRTLVDLLDAAPARLADIELAGAAVIRADQMMLRGYGGFRGERVWLVGPDAKGLVAVFDEASPYPHSTRVTTRPLSKRRLADRPRDPRGRATAVADAAFRLFVCRWGFTIVITICIGLELGPQPQVLAWLYAVAGIVIAIGMARDWLRPERVLRAGRLLAAPLVEYPARLVADRSFAVRLDDGAELVAKIAWERDVVANVRASGRLWIAGTPLPGATLGVGVPDFPVAGVVRFN
ncbi:hypothetical protein GCM10018954_012180 [Kutzneria kofuensis]